MANANGCVAFAVRKKRDGDDHTGAVVRLFSAIVAHTFLRTLARLTATCSAAPAAQLCLARDIHLAKLARLFANCVVRWACSEAPPLSRAGSKRTQKTSRQQHTGSKRKEAEREHEGMHRPLSRTCSSKHRPRASRSLLLLGCCRTGSRLRVLPNVLCSNAPVLDVVPPEWVRHVALLRGPSASPLRSVFSAAIIAGAFFASTIAFVAFIVRCFDKRFFDKGFFDRRLPRLLRPPPSSPSVVWPTASASLVCAGYPRPAARGTRGTMQRAPPYRAHRRPMVGPPPKARPPGGRRRWGAAGPRRRARPGACRSKRRRAAARSSQGCSRRAPTPHTSSTRTCNPR